MLTFSAPLLLLAGAQAASANLFNDDARGAPMSSEVEGNLAALLAPMSSEVEGTRNLDTTTLQPFMNSAVTPYVALAADTFNLCATAAVGLTLFTPNKGGTIFLEIAIYLGIAASSFSAFYLVNLLLLVLNTDKAKYPLVVVAIVINGSAIVLYALTSAGYLVHRLAKIYVWGVKLASFLLAIAGYRLLTNLSHNDAIYLANPSLSFHDTSTSVVLV